MATRTRKPVWNKPFKDLPLSVKRGGRCLPMVKHPAKTIAWDYINFWAEFKGRKGEVKRVEITTIKPFRGAGASGSSFIVPIDLPLNYYTLVFHADAYYNEGLIFSKKSEEIPIAL